MGKRVGEFHISRTYIERPEIRAGLVQMEFVPVRVELLGYEDYYKMLGFSPMFDEIEEGMMAPVYDVQFDCDDEQVIVKRL